MGRGRQKAKQTKVARELKYFSPETDYDSLQRELSRHDGIPVDTPVDTPATDADDVDPDERDEYADWSTERRH